MYVIYGKTNCAQCHMAKQLLRAKDIDYVYKNIGEDEMTVESLSEITGFPLKTAPVILEKSPDGLFTYIGGYKELNQRVSS